MDQHDHRQHRNKPMLNDIEPSTIRTHFGSKKSVSFSSYLKPYNDTNNNNNHNNKLEECDEICVFDTQQPKELSADGIGIVPPIRPRLSSVSSSVETISSYRMRSFQTTPTASSEASWNSQVGLLVGNPPGSHGISPIKCLYDTRIGNRGTNNSNVGPRWPRISTKWLNRGRKCPCLCKKSVQVVEKTVNLKTIPKMVDQRNSITSNGSTPLYSPKQTSPRILGLSSLHVPSSTEPIISRNPNDPNFDCVVKNQIEYIGYSTNSNNNSNIYLSNGGISPLGLNSMVLGPLTSYGDTDIIKGDGVTSTDTVTLTKNNGFTFPILENQPIGLKKMFNVTGPSHYKDEGPNRDSTEAFQPKVHSGRMSRRTSCEEENASDASSDLFEIESISTTSSPYRDLIDEPNIVPNSNFGTCRTKLGIIGLGYINQGINNNNVHENGECCAPRDTSIDPVKID